MTIGQPLRLDAFPVLVTLDGGKYGVTLNLGELGELACGEVQGVGIHGRHLSEDADMFSLRHPWAKLGIPGNFWEVPSN